jgi:hypothetical protein
VIPGIGRQNAIAHLRALMRDHQEALRRAYDAASHAWNLRWKIRHTAEDLLKDTAERRKAERAILEILATPTTPYGGEIYEQLADAIGVNELLAPPTARRRR